MVVIDDECEGWIGEYGFDVFFYLREREKHLVVEEDYLIQSSVSPEMRAVLVDWLLQVEYSCLCYYVVTMYVVMGHSLG